MSDTSKKWVIRVGETGLDRAELPRHVAPRGWLEQLCVSLLVDTLAVNCSINNRFTAMGGMQVQKFNVTFRIECPRALCVKLTLSPLLSETLVMRWMRERRNERYLPVLISADVPTH